MFDILIHGGMVLDGTGSEAVLADVAIRGDRIVALGALVQAARATGTPLTNLAAECIDASGLVLAPGFIDMHTHSDFTLLVDGSADSQICQGVTTEVIGQCGFSAAPLAAQPDPSQMLGHMEAGVALDWRSFAQYLDRLQAARPAVNVAAFVGHGALRRVATANRSGAGSQAVAVPVPAPAPAPVPAPAPEKAPATGDCSAAEMQHMVQLAEQAFDEGAMGLSTGLEYWPGNQSPDAELQAMAAVAARRGKLYATHVRNRDVDCETSFAEALRTARRSGARLQISHIQPKYGAPPQAMALALEQIDQATREGVDVAFDVIPHEWSHTVVIACLPAWAREGGIEQTRLRLQDPVQRERMKHNPRPIWRLVSDGQWSRIVLLTSQAHPELVGLDFAHIGRLRHCSPHDAVFDLLLDEGPAMAQLMWTSKNFDDADICLCLQDARCSVMSDTLAVSAQGPLQGTIGSLGGYGWVARLLGHYARDRGVLSLAQAVHRITGRPAERLGLRDRGVLREGAFADLVVFDPAQVQDRSSIAQPAQHPNGFVHVLVNGSWALRQGLRVGGVASAPLNGPTQRAGRVLRGD